MPHLLSSNEFYRTLPTRLKGFHWTELPYKDQLGESNIVSRLLRQNKHLFKRYWNTCQNRGAVSSARKGKSLSACFNKSVKYSVRCSTWGSGAGREGKDAAGVAGAAGLFLFPPFLRAVPAHAWLRADAAAFIPRAHTGKAISWGAYSRSTELCVLYSQLQLASSGPKGLLGVRLLGRGMQRDTGQGRGQGLGRGEGPREWPSEGG